MSRHRTRLYPIVVLLCSDVAAVAVAFLIALWVRFYLNIIPLAYDIPRITEYYKLMIFCICTTVFFQRFYGLYKRENTVEAFDEFFLNLKSVSFSFLFVMAITFLYRQFSYSRLVILIAWFNTLVMMVFSRNIASCILVFFEKKLNMRKRLAIIGINDISESLCKKILKNPRFSYDFQGFVKTGLGDISTKDNRVLGDVKDLASILVKSNIEEVILTSQEISSEETIKIITQCEKHMIAFKLVPDILGLITSKVELKTLGGVALLGIKDPPLYHPVNRRCKRAVDVIGSLFGLLFLSPIFVVCAVLVKISSPGPVFYAQQRIGEDGKLFMMYKFRTMHTDAEKQTGPVWTTKNDSRRTQIGAFMRKYNVDELPQFYNVLKGDMSLVGPRPERPYFVAQFKEDVPRYMSRHKIKSGMSGWAQINGFRGDTSIEKRTKYDLYYIENWSLLLDFKIMLLSLTPSILENAY